MMLSTHLQQFSLEWPAVRDGLGLLPLSDRDRRESQLSPDTRFHEVDAVYVNDVPFPNAAFAEQLDDQLMDLPAVGLLLDLLLVVPHLQHGSP